MKYEDSEYTIECSGRKFYAFTGQLAPVEDADPETQRDLTYGYDGYVSEFDLSEGPLTPEERAEIAEYMIARWRAWGAR